MSNFESVFSLRSKPLSCNNQTMSVSRGFIGSFKWVMKLSGSLFVQFYKLLMPCILMRVSYLQLTSSKDMALNPVNSGNWLPLFYMKGTTIHKSKLFCICQRWCLLAAIMILVGLSIDFMNLISNQAWLESYFIASLPRNHHVFEATFLYEECVADSSWRWCLHNCARRTCTLCGLYGRFLAQGKCCLPAKPFCKLSFSSHHRYVTTT